jgi:hypothetical protein
MGISVCIFHNSRTAVIRGRIVTQDGAPLIGVRISSKVSQEGFTLSRHSGWFDFMVNGGGVVTLLFSRSPFRKQYRTVSVPWNEVVIINDIVMSTKEDQRPSTESKETCLSHNYQRTKPIVLATWKNGFQGNCPQKSAVLVESQVSYSIFFLTSTHCITSPYYSKILISGRPCMRINYDD